MFNSVQSENTSKTFDPLVTSSLKSNLSNPDTYWASTTEHMSCSTLHGEQNSDIVIIGAGYTGLSCAIHLTELGFSNVTVLEANTIGWGCSGRNAGFVLPGSGRLGYAQLVDRYGKTAALALHEDYLSAIQLIEQLNVKTKTNIDKSEQGYLKLAHSKHWLNKLQTSADYLATNFDYQVEFIDKHKLQQQYVNHCKAQGAIRYTNGFGINPLKLINSYAEYAKSLGVKIFTNSAVTSIEKMCSSRTSTKTTKHIVKTAEGQVNCKQLVFSTNGYTTKHLTSPLQNKILPVLTNVVVTRPLTREELELTNFKTRQVMMDTRELKYYYRLLPDNRLLFGGRGAITGKDANNPIYQNRLLDEIKSTFIGLNNITIDYNWIGWIAVSYDQMPHIYGSEDNQFYATGYCGSGVSFSAFAGKQLAELIGHRELGTTKPQSALLSELPSFPFAPMRRLGQRAFYQYGRLKDLLT